MYAIRNLRTTIETRKDTMVPTASTTSSRLENANPNFTILRRLAPNITGMARKKVYSAATFLDTPISSAPTMVAPERDVPGNTAAITWKIPISMAVL